MTFPVHKLIDTNDNPDGESITDIDETPNAPASTDYTTEHGEDWFLSVMWMSDPDRWSWAATLYVTSTRYHAGADCISGSVLVGPGAREIALSRARAAADMLGGHTR